MNRLLNIQLKIAKEKDIKSFKKSEGKEPYELQAQECPKEEELDESVLDPKKEDKKPENVKKVEEKKKKPEQELFVVDDIAEDTLEKLFERLPKIEDSPKKESDFYRPKESNKPLPLNENIVKIDFPPKEQLLKTKSQNVDDTRFAPNVDLLIRSFSPTGSIENLRREIRINFSHSMYQEEFSTIDSKKSDEEINTLQKRIERFITVEPALPKKGKWNWESTTMLVFSPPALIAPKSDEEENENDQKKTKLRDVDYDSTYTPSTKYTVKIKKGTKSVRGYTLKNECTFSFSTTVLTALKVVPAATRHPSLTKNAILGVAFSQDVNKAKLFKKMYLSKSTGSEDYMELVELKMKDVVKRVNNESFFQFQVDKSNNPINVFRDFAEVTETEVKGEIGKDIFEGQFIRRMVEEPDEKDPKITKLVEKMFIPKVQKFDSNVVFFTTKKRLDGNQNYTLFIKKGITPLFGNIPSDRNFSFSFKTMENLYFVEKTIPSQVYENDQFKWHVKFNNDISLSHWNKNKKNLLSTKNIDNATIYFDQKTNSVFIEGKIPRKKKKCHIVFSKKIEDIYGNTLSEKKDLELKILKREFQINNSIHDTSQHCHDNVHWGIYFNWDVNVEQFEKYKKEGNLKKLMSIKPNLKNEEWSVIDNAIIISGNPIGFENFTIQINKKLLCKYGTELIKNYELRVRVKSEPKILRSQFNGKVFVLDPLNHYSPYAFKFQTRNYEKVRVIVYRVDPSVDFLHAYPMGIHPINVTRWNKFCQNKDVYDLTGIDKKKIVFNKNVNTDSKFNEIKNHYFDLTPFSKNKKEKTGQFYIVIGPSSLDLKESPDSSQLNKCIYSWVQVTNLSFESVLSNNQTITLVANKLKDGIHCTEDEMKKNKISYEFLGYPSKEIKKHKVTEKDGSDIDEYYIYEESVKVKKLILKCEGNKSGVTVCDYSQQSEIFKNKNNLIVLETKNDKCFVPCVKYNYPDMCIVKTKLIAFVFDDKSIFKPEEKINVKAILRYQVYENGDRRLEKVPAGKIFKYSIIDPRKAKWKSDSVEVSDNSFIFITVDIPEGVNLGEQVIKFEEELPEDTPENIKGEEFEHRFSVQEFKQPDFLIAVKPKDEKRKMFINSENLLTTKATYYSGAGLYNCKVDWEVKQRVLKDFRPKGKYNNYSFSLNKEIVSNYPYVNYKNEKDRPKDLYNLKNSDSKTAVNGECNLLVQCLNPKKEEKDDNHSLIQKRNSLITEAKLRMSNITITTLSNGKKVVLPLVKDKSLDCYSTIKCDVTSKVTDMTLKTLSSNYSFDIYPSRFFIGLCVERAIVYENEEANVGIVVVDSEGKMVKKDIPFVIEVFKDNKKMRDLMFKTEEKKETKIKIPFYKEWNIGKFYIVATVFDEKGFMNVSSCSVEMRHSPLKMLDLSVFDRRLDALKHVNKKSLDELKEDKNENGKVKIILDKDSYFVKDVARIILKSDIPGSYLFYIHSHSMVLKKSGTIDEKTKEVNFEIDINEDCVPNCKFIAIVTGKAKRVDVMNYENDKNLFYPKSASGFCMVNVSDKHFKLDLKITPAEEVLSPGSESSCTVEVNKPGKSLLTFLIVDDSVLSLTGYKLQFPLSKFYPSNFIYTYYSFFRELMYVRRCELNESKLKSKKEEILNEKKEAIKKDELEKLKKERSIEAGKIRIAKMKELQKKEERKRELYKIKQDLKQKKLRPPSDIPPPPPRRNTESSFGRGGGFLSQIRKGGFKLKKVSIGAPRNFFPEKPKIEDRRDLMACLQSSISMRKTKMIENDSDEDDSDEDYSDWGDGADDFKSNDEEKYYSEEKYEGEEEDDENVKENFSDGSSSDSESSSSDDEIIGDDESTGGVISMRKMFNSTVCFVNSIYTDENGKAIVKFKLPDNLTSYSIWCLAEQGMKFYGFGSSSVKASLPFNIRENIPSFLNFGDRIKCEFVLSNNIDKKLKLNVAFRTGGQNLFSYGKKGYVVTIPKGIRGTINYDVLAKDVGQGKLQIAASAGKFNDAMEKEMKVYTPALVSNFVVYGELDSDSCHVQQILPPNISDVFPGFGGLEIQTSSTIFQQLTDAFLYVYNYEFDCMEQTCSRIMSIYTMIDIVEMFKLKDIDKRDQIEKVLKRSLLKLCESQKSNGGFGMWNKDSPINVYISNHAAHVVIRCKERWPNLFEGAGIVAKKLRMLLDSCKKFIQTMTSYVPVGYKREANCAVRSFCLYVLALYSKVPGKEGDFGLLDKKEFEKCGKRVKKLMNEIIKSGEDNQTNETKAWILFAVDCFLGTEKEEDEKLKKTYRNSLLASLYKTVVEEKETAYFQKKVDYDFKTSKLEMLGSPIRESGVILEVLCNIDPTSPIIPKMAKHLLKLKKFGKWGNTNENQSVLLGLVTYLKKFESEEPDFNVDCWVKEEFMGSIGFKGRETSFKEMVIPMQKLVITEDEKKIINEKKKILAEKARKLREEKEKMLNSITNILGTKFNGLFNAVKEEYEESVKNVKVDHSSEMNQLEEEIISGEKKETPKKNFKLYGSDTGSGFKNTSEGKEVKNVDEDDIEYYKKQIERKQKGEEKKVTPIDSEIMNYFEKKIKKELMLNEFTENHFEREDKILNNLKNKQVYLMKKGKGRLYYRLKFKYAPKDLKLYAYDFGFNVTRSYSPLLGQDSKSVVKDKKSGMYTIKHGELVRVRLEISINQRRFHVALVDHVPAGLEVINPNMDKVQMDEKQLYNRRWYDHVNYRQERVEVFAQELSGGKFGFSYVCKAKYRGIFTSVPAEASEMYNEEINGASESDFVEVIEVKKIDESDDEDDDLPPPPPDF